MHVAPYGTWPSPVDAAQVASSSVRLEEVHLVDGFVYWTERRPHEKGRSVLLRAAPGRATEELTPAPYSVRTRVHEYGGGAFGVHQQSVYFANDADQGWYRWTPESITAVMVEPQQRFADPAFYQDGLVVVSEDHRGQGEPINRLEWVDGGTRRVLHSGHDFYASPAAGPGRLAWLSWDHPAMPWDGTTLWVGDGLGEPVAVAGGPQESIFQPVWAADGTLYFVSDRSGWWNLWQWDGQQVAPCLLMEAEFGRPQWVFGTSTYGLTAAGTVVCSYFQRDRWRLATWTPGGGLVPVETDFTEIRSLRVEGTHAAFIGESPTRPAAVVRWDLEAGTFDIVREAGVAGEGYARPQAVDFPTRDGSVGHAWFYPPTLAGYRGPPDERPPLLVKSHGGPTSCATTALNLEIQYWTSRGIAVLDVNYGGSTGYGRSYRERLRGRWGEVDVHDCVDAAGHMVEQGLADGERLAIDGKSAGGYTTLAVLTFTDVFKAGASYYGICDLESLQHDTHKFESRYNDGLVGPYPQAVELYRARSPIHHTDGLSCPIILFQGLEDMVVPPNQAHMMYEAVRKKGLPVALLTFEGEQHGFRQAANIERALGAEFLFFARVFGFEPADHLPDIPIENLGVTRA